MNTICDKADQIMEEEVNYVTVTFKTIAGISAQKNANNQDVIYEELKTDYIYPVLPENKKKAPLCSLIHLLAAGLGIICIVLVSVVIALCIRFNRVMSEQHTERAQHLMLHTQKTSLEQQREELIREKDGLNWTLEVIMQYENFPVKTFCPQKKCKHCLDGWVLFQSSCYLFNHSKYHWRTWNQSREECSKMKADLVVIESQEEQEFIDNHTKTYDDHKHGYWIGLMKKMNTWMWVDGSNYTVTYWQTQEPGYTISCALSLPLADADPLANWRKAGCNMKNRWICETRALIK